MAATSVELSTAGGYVELLKNKYLPAIVNQIHRQNVILNKVQQARSEELVGNSVVLPIQTAESSGMVQESAITDEVDLPAGRSAQYDQMTIAIRRLYATIQVPDIARYRSQGMGGYVDPWRSEILSIKRQIMNLLSKLYFGDQTGTLATVASFSNGTPDTVTVDSTRNLWPGMLIDFVRSGSDVSNAVDVTITNVTSETTFTCTISGTPTTGDIIVLANSYNKAEYGLAAFADNTDTSFQGINRTNIFTMQSNVVHNGAGDGTSVAFKPAVLKTLITKCRRRRLQKPDAILTTNDVYDAISAVLWPDRRFDSNQKAEYFDTGFSFDGIPIMVDDDCSNSALYTPTWMDIGRGMIGELIMPHQDPSGGGFIRPSFNSGNTGYSSGWEASFVHMGNLFLRDAQGFGYMDEIYSLADGLSAGSVYGNAGGYA